MANGDHMKRLDDITATIFVTVINTVQPPNDNNKDNLASCNFCEDDKIESMKPFKKSL